MMEYLEENVTLYKPGEPIRVAGFEIVVNEAKILDVLEYNYTREGKTVVVRDYPKMAKWTGGQPQVVGDAVYVYVDVTWRKLTEEEIKSFGEKVGPGPLAILFAPWLILFPAEQELEPGLLDIVVSFDDKWIENRKVNIDPKAPHDQIGLKAVDPGWTGRGKILFIIPKGSGNVQAVLTVRAECPLGVTHPLCSPGLPVAKISVQQG